MYFFTFSCKLLSESNISFLSCGSKEGSNDLEIIALSKKKRPYENLHLFFYVSDLSLNENEFGTI